MLLSQFEDARRAIVSESSASTSRANASLSTPTSADAVPSSPATSAAVTGEAFRALFAACNDAIATKHVGC
jgi:hypothetical protein